MQTNRRKRKGFLHKLSTSLVGRHLAIPYT